MPGLLEILANPAVSSLIGSVGSGVANHLVNRSLSNNAFRQNVQMWNLQNQYNSPSAQVSRLIAAGLNPALAYGGSSQVVGNSDSPPQLDYSGVFNQPIVQPDAVMQAQQALSMDLDREYRRKQIEKTEAETIESLNRGRLSGAEADLAKEFATEKLQSMRLSNDKIVKQCEEIDQTINNLIATRNLTAQQHRALELANELNDRVMEERVASFGLQNKETIARIRELHGRLQKYSAEVGVLVQSAKKLATENAFLPGLLTTDLAAGIKNIEIMNKTSLKLDEEIREIAASANLTEKEVRTYIWRMVFGELSDVQSHREARDRNKSAERSSGAAVAGAAAAAARVIL